jgi:hypothetical protein
MAVGTPPGVAATASGVRQPAASNPEAIHPAEIALATSHRDIGKGISLEIGLDIGKESCAAVGTTEGSG